MGDGRHYGGRDARHRSIGSRLRGYGGELRRLDRAHGRLVPTWLARLFAVCAILLIPWSVILVVTLPSHTVAHEWGIAWAGFDIGMALALAALATAIVRRLAWAGPLAAVCGTLLVVDAWFDITTAAPGRHQAVAIGMAVLLEVPLALLCFTIARHVERVVVQARRYLDTAGVHLVHGRLVGPDGPGPSEEPLDGAPAAPEADAGLLSGVGAPRTATTATGPGTGATVERPAGPSR